MGVLLRVVEIACIFASFIEHMLHNHIRWHDGINLSGRGALCAMSLQALACYPPPIVSHLTLPAYNPSCSLIDSRTKRSYSTLFSR